MSLALLAFLACSGGSEGPPRVVPEGEERCTGDECQEVGATCDADRQCVPGTYCGERTQCVSDCAEDSECSACDANGRCTDDDSITGFDDTVLFGDEVGNEPEKAEPEACVELDVVFEQVIPTVLLLIDQSGSMDFSFPQEDPEETKTRWETVVSTLSSDDGFINRMQNSIRFGLSLYTSFNGYGPLEDRQCPVLERVLDDPANGQHSIGLGNFAPIRELLQSAEPEEDTPTGESVVAATEQLVAYEEDGPKFILLATDGEPDTCTDPDPDSQETHDAAKAQSVAAVEAAFEAGIGTHIISIGSEVSAPHLKDLAVAGSGGDQSAEAFTALNTTALEEAFNQIIGTVRSCDFTLEGTVATNQASRGTVLLDDQALGFEDENGWEMPDEQTVRLKGTSCDRVQEDAGSLSMSFPCGVYRVVPR